MNKKQYLVLFIIYSLTFVFGGLYFLNFKINSNILKTLNQKIYSHELTKALNHYEDELAKEVLILVKDKDSIKKIIHELREQKLLRSIDAKINLEKSKQIYEYYFKHRRSLLSLKHITMVEDGDLSLIKKSASRKLYSPFNAFVGSFPHDPYLLFQDSFKPAHMGAHFDIEDGFIRLKSSKQVGYLITGQLESVEKAESLLSTLRKNKNILSFFSLSFYGVKAKQQAFLESNLFFTLSILLILIAFFYYFKTVRHVLISTGLISFSCIFSLYCTHFMTGEIHVITFLLGISILGIIADYFIHFFMEETDPHTLCGKEGGRKIQKPMLYSLVTSVIGFAVFRFAPLPVLKQFSIFSMTALVVAFLCVRFLLPVFFVKGGQQEGMSWNEKLFISLLRVRLFKPFWGGVLLMTFLLTLNTKVLNDVRTFSTRDTELYTHEQLLRKMLKMDSQMGQMIIFGKTLQEALEKEEQIKEKLVSSGVKGSFFSDWLPSVKMQKRSLRSYEVLDAHLDEYLRAFKIADVMSIKNNIKQASKSLVKDNNFIDKRVLTQHIGQVGKHYYLIAPILSNEKNIDLSLFSSHSVRYLNKLNVINQALDEFSSLILKGIVIFYMMAFLLLFYRFGFYSSLRILGPTFFSICTSLSICSLVYGSLNLFHVLGAILIIALGLDFSFFYFFNRKKSSSVGRAVSLSTITTLSSFGVLSISRTHAISSFGIVVLMGILICWLFVPGIVLKEVETDV